MKLLAKNRRATFDFSIEKTLQAGIILEGHEVKSIRNSHVSLKGSFATIKDGELWLHNMHVTPYGFSTQPFAANYDPAHARKLLVNKRELEELQQAKIAGRTIVPTAIFAGRFIKIEIGIAKGKKNFDKRQAIKKRDEDRAIARKLKKADY